MIMRIKSTDFSNFAGMRWEHPDNIILDKYLKAFKENPDFHYFQVEDQQGIMDFDVVCYIAEQLKNCNMFTKVDRDDNGKILLYWLCFYKKE